MSVTHIQLWLIYHFFEHQLDWHPQVVLNPHRDSTGEWCREMWLLKTWAFIDFWKTRKLKTRAPWITHHFHLEAKDSTVNCTVEKWYNNQRGKQITWAVESENCALTVKLHCLKMYSMPYGLAINCMNCGVLSARSCVHDTLTAAAEGLLTSHRWMSQQWHLVATSRRSSKLESKYCSQSLGIRMSKHTAQVHLSLFSFITLLYGSGEMIESQWVEK